MTKRRAQPATASGGTIVTRQPQRPRFTRASRYGPGLSQLKAPARRIGRSRSRRACLSTWPTRSRSKSPPARGLPEFQADWRDLIARADVANVFMHPVLVALSACYPNTRSVALLAWRDDGGRPQLVGFWAFAVGRAPRSIMPISVLAAPPFAHAISPRRLSIATCSTRRLQAMLDCIAGDPSLPKIVVLETDAHGRRHPCRRSFACSPRAAARPAFSAARCARCSPPSSTASNIWKRRCRARAARSCGSIGAGSRKKARSNSKVVTEPEAVGQGRSRTFCGWRPPAGRAASGTALLCNPADATFTRDMVAALAAQGDAAIHALYLDGRPVSMQIVLRAGAAAFTWKTAYDETLARFFARHAAAGRLHRGLACRPEHRLCRFLLAGRQQLHGGLERAAGDGANSGSMRGAAGLPRSPHLSAACKRSTCGCARRPRPPISRTCGAGPDGASRAETMRCGRRMSRSSAAGLRAPLAAAMLGRAGIDAVWSIRTPVYPPDFRCEKLDGVQVEILKKTGLAEAVLRGGDAGPRMLGRPLRPPDREAARRSARHFLRAAGQHHPRPHSATRGYGAPRQPRSPPGNDAADGHDCRTARRFPRGWSCWPTA